MDGVVSTKVARCSTEDELIISEVTCDQSRVFKIADPYHHVCVSKVWVNELVTELYFDVNVGVQ